MFKFQNWSEYTKKYTTGDTFFPMEILAQYSKGKILDIGCGLGGHLSKIKNYQEKRGIDPSDLAIEKAKKAFPDCSFIKGSAYNLPFTDNYFDLVISIDTIEHLERPEKMLKEAQRVLKPGGKLIIQTPNYPVKRLYDLYYFLHPRSSRHFFGDDPTHISKFSCRKLKKLLDSYFTKTELKARNIFFEKRMPILKKVKDNWVGFLIGQKIIAVYQKNEQSR